MSSQTYDMLNKAWTSTTKILFGQEIGELKEFEDYLKPAAIGQQVASSFSGKKLWAALCNYPKNAKFFDYSEEHNTFDKLASQPFNINRIKDLDSIVETLHERFVYSGNKVLGNSKYIENSDAIVDSTAIFNSSKVISSKYVAYSSFLQKNEYTFGSMSSGESSHILRCFYNNNLRRCFEVSTCVGVSDSYFSYNLLQCSDCLFSFNIRAKRYMIGNIQLESKEYTSLKTKLVSEIVDSLRRKKQLDFSIINIMNNA